MSLRYCSIFSLWLCLASTSLVTNQVWANEAEKLLMRMDKAFVELSYDGVFTYFSGGDLTSLRVVHKQIDGVQRERLVHLNGAPREIIRHGGNVDCIVMPGDDLAALEQSIPAGPFTRAFVRQFDRLSDTYSVEQFGEGRVANRMATRIVVRPLDKHRYGYRLWLDQNTALLLRSELIDHAGNRLEIFQFTHLIIGDAVRDEDLEASEHSGSMVNHLRLEPLQNGLPVKQTAMDWNLGWVPPGFEMATADIRRKPASVENVSSLMYSDGLATFSVFIEPMPKHGAASMVSMNGATVAITRRVDSGQVFHLATLVGEIPEATGQQIIRSIRRN